MTENTTHTTREAIQYWYDAATERRQEIARLRAVLARIGRMADHWERALPEVIRTPAVVSALRATLEPAAEAAAVVSGRTADETQGAAQCSAAAFKHAHGPHSWEPQPGMEPVRCPGACRCEHPDDEHSVYGCVDGCPCEHLPARKKPPMDPVHILGIGADEEPAVPGWSGEDAAGEESEWCKCPSCWGWFVEDHPGEDLDELGKDLGWWSGLPEHRDAPAVGGAQQPTEA